MLARSTLTLPSPSPTAQHPQLCLPILHKGTVALMGRFRANSSSSMAEQHGAAWGDPTTHH